MIKLIVSVVLILVFCVSVLSESVSNDVILEKINNMQISIDNLNTTFKETKASRDNQILRLEQESVDNKVCITEVKASITAIYTILGLIGGGGGASALFIRSRMKNGKGDNNGSTK